MHRVSQRYTELQATRRGSPAPFARRLATFLPALTQCYRRGENKAPECFGNAINTMVRGVAGDLLPRDAELRADQMRLCPVAAGPVLDDNLPLDLRAVHELAYIVVDNPPSFDTRGEYQPAVAFTNVEEALGHFHNGILHCLGQETSESLPRLTGCVRDAAVGLADGLRTVAKATRADGGARLFAGTLCAVVGKRGLASHEAPAQNVPLSTASVFGR